MNDKSQVGADKVLKSHTFFVPWPKISKEKTSKIQALALSTIKGCCKFWELDKLSFQIHVKTQSFVLDFDRKSLQVLMFDLKVFWWEKLTKSFWLKMPNADTGSSYQKLSCLLRLLSEYEWFLPISKPFIQKEASKTNKILTYLFIITVPTQKTLHQVQKGKFGLVMHWFISLAFEIMLCLPEFNIEVFKF